MKQGFFRTLAGTRCATILGVGVLLASGASVSRADEGIVNAGVTLASIHADYIDGIGANGWRPTRLNGYREGASERFATRWVKNTDNRLWAAKPSQTGSEFGSEVTYRKANTWRPIDVGGYNNGTGAIRFNSVWEKNPANVKWNIYRDQSIAQMTNLANTIGAQGWKPRKIEGYLSAGQSRFVSYWEFDPNGALELWHSRLTPAEYQQKLGEYGDQGYSLISIHSHVQGGDTYMSAVWRKVARSLMIRTNREVVPFQRYANNYWAQGYNYDIIYGVQTAAGTRYGGMWVYDEPRPNSTLNEQIARQVNGAPAIGGAFVYNETTGESAGAHADRVFAIASSAKIGILYAVLRGVDVGDFTWGTLINSGSAMGQNNANRITANTNYTVQQLAGWMIADSNNWATNLLTKTVGMDKVNARLANLGLTWTRINRYMIGTGSPSVHGNSSAYADRVAGWENTSTPREMVTLLRKVWKDNVLTNTSETRFWATMNLDSNGGTNTKGYCGGVASLYNPPIVLFNKAGNNNDLRAHRAEGGRLAFPDGQQVFYMICMDFISDDPDDTAASNTALGACTTAMANIGTFIAQRFY